MNKILAFTCAISLTIAAGATRADVVDDLLKEYQSKGASNFSAENGKKRWFEEHPDPEKPGSIRNCSTCHTKDFKAKGKHAKTGKVIDPLAPSVNDKRLTDKKFIEKWFKRNCKWVLERECTPQEKGDFLLFIRAQ